MTLFGLMEMSAAELMLRQAALAILESSAERDRAALRSKCGCLCDDTDGFKDALAERLLESIE
jgi:hypothetical protein